MWYHKKQPNLNIWVKFFLKCSLWTIAAKLESAGAKIFYRSWSGIEWDKQDMPNFNSDPLTCDPALFPTKNSPKIQKVTIFSCIGPCFWHIWIAQWLKLFCGDGYIFFLNFSNLHWEMGGGEVWGEVKVGPRMQTFNLSIFHKKTQILQNKKIWMFLFVIVLPLARCLANWTIFGRVRTQKPPKIGQFNEYGINTQVPNLTTYTSF